MGLAYATGCVLLRQKALSFVPHSVESFGQVEKNGAYIVTGVDSVESRLGDSF